jgi:hypothetical protein
LGIWRDLGYAYAAITILGGILLLISGFSASFQSSYNTDYGTNNAFSSVFNQFRGLGLIYGGFSAITLGLLLIWALVKSGQIENIDKNIQVIARWAKSQMQKDSLITNESTEESDATNK